MKPDRTRSPAVITPRVLTREQMPEKSRLEFLAGTIHHFDNPRALKEVARLASKWFGQHLAGSVECTSQP